MFFLPSCHLPLYAFSPTLRLMREFFFFLLLNMLSFLFCFQRKKLEPSASSLTKRGRWGQRLLSQAGAEAS